MENHLNGEIVREEFLEASLSLKVQHNKVIYSEKDGIDVKSFSNCSLGFKRNAAGDRRQGQQQIFKEQRGEANLQGKYTNSNYRHT